MKKMIPSLPKTYREELNCWQYDDNENCYAYAICCRSGISHLIPGMVTGYECNDDDIYCDEELIERFLADMKEIGISVEVSSLEERISCPNEWKIAILNVTTTKYMVYDFHFMRQDMNGIWHHKFCDEQFPECLDSSNQVIVDPSKAKLGYQYHLVGYYKLSYNFQTEGALQ